MANVLNTMYPPELDTFLPAFLVSTEDIVVPFSYSSYTTMITSDTVIHYSLVDQMTNSNVLNDSSGIEIAGQILYSNDDVTKPYFTIPIKSVVKGGALKNNQYYKLQARFDINNASYRPSENFDKLAYISNMDRQANFSEWSSVCLLRPIWEPKIKLVKFDETRAEGVQLSFPRGIIPIVGHMDFQKPTGSSASGANDKETERLQRYRVHIDSEFNTDICVTEWFMSGDNTQDPNSINCQVDLQSVSSDEGSQFTLRIEYYTASQYYGVEEREFRLAEYNEDSSFSPKITATIDNDHGCINLHVTNDKTVFGVLYLKRSDSKSNFTEWENLKIYIVGSQGSDSPGPIDLNFSDDTVASMMWYRYSVQLRYNGGMFSPVYRSDVVISDFYDMYLKRLDQSVPIKYNYRITSFKPVVTRVKTDTLGGRYPRFAENANLNYKQFSMTGLISAQADDAQSFMKKTDWFTERQYTRYLDYKTYELRTDYTNTDDLENITPFSRIDKLDEAYIAAEGYDPGYVVLTQDPVSMDESYDWLWEREFREELVKWLNDGEPKLYRSMTEGNMCVMLMDITLTPNATLGRRIWDFSATAYEVEDGYSLDKLSDLGIIDIYTTNSRSVVGKKDSRFVGGGTSGTIDDTTTDDSSGESIDILNPYINVTKPGQIYLCDLDDSRQYINVPSGYGNIVSSIIGSQVAYRYSGGLASSEPTSYYINNVKISFLGEPHRFALKNDGTLEKLSSQEADGSGMIANSMDSAPTNYSNKITEKVDNENKSQKILLGYRFQLTNNKINSNNTTLTTIFVPYRPTDEIVWDEMRMKTVKHTTTVVNEETGLEEDVEIETQEEEYVATHRSVVNGYYQIPANIEVSEIYFPDAINETNTDDPIGNGDIVSVDYILNYKEQSRSEIDTVSSIEIIRTVIGQYSELMNYDVDLFNDIYNKYEVIVTDSDGDITYTDKLQYLRGIRVDVEPYSLLDIKYIDSSSYTRLLVGRSGVMHLIKDNAISSLKFVGRQMFKVDAGVVSPREWEYIEDNKLYSSFADIPELLPNHVYNVGGTYYIYYHSAIEEFERMFQESTNNDGEVTRTYLGMGVARVPVQGVVDYYADIVRVRRA